MTTIEQLKNDPPESSGRQKYEIQSEDDQLLVKPVAAIGVLLAALVVWVRDMVGDATSVFQPVSEAKAQTRIVDGGPVGIDPGDNYAQSGAVADDQGANSSTDGTTDQQLRVGSSSFGARLENPGEEFPQKGFTNLDATPVDHATPRGLGRNENFKGFSLANSENSFEFSSDGKSGGGSVATTGDGDVEETGNTINAPENGDNDDQNLDSNQPDGQRNGNNGSNYNGNRAPLIAAAVVLGDMLVNQSRTLALDDLLENVSDPDNDVLAIENLRASSGSLIANDDGTWTFTPEANDTTGVTFTFDVTDGEYTVPQTASLDLISQPGETITGTDASERLGGSAGGDNIDAGGGDDTVFALDRADIVQGGAGDDLIFGGDGDDILFGNDGNDTIFGGQGDDIIIGGDGDDVLIGEEGSDVVIGEEGADQFIATINDGNDIYNGGDGIDTYDISGTTTGVVVDLAQETASSAQTGQDQIIDIENVIGSQADDVIRGDDQINVLSGGEGDDEIDGGAGDDIIDAGDGDDIVDAGEGDDEIIASVSDGDDSYDGGSGTDTYDLSGTTSNATIDLAAQTAESADIGQDHIFEFENVTGGDGDDVIRGDNQINVLSGGDGDDEIDGGDGDDTVDAGEGDDVIIASGSAIIAGGDGDDEIEAGKGNDIIAAGDGNDKIDAGKGNDIIAAGNGNDEVDAGKGNDVVNAGQGNDVVDAGKGDDEIIASVSDGNDIYYGGKGSDTYDLSKTTSDATIDLVAQTAESADIGQDLIFEFENVIGGDGDDVIIADDSFNILTGGAGNDTFVFQTIEDAFLSNLTRDQITDFEVGDKIDLSEIDADWGQDGNQAFDWLDNLPDSDDSGSLQFRFAVVDGEEYTIVEGTVEWEEGDVEFEIELVGRHELSQADFIGVG